MSANTAVEIISNKLYWISDKTPPRNQKNSFYFCIDDELVYQPFCNDFGPLNIGMTYKFCVELEKLVKNTSTAGCKIFHYTSLSPQKRSNAALLMGAFQIIVCKRSAKDAWAPFSMLPTFLEFRDAGYGSCTYKCTVLHCLKGLEKAIELSWFSYSKFNLEEYEYYEKVENGDWNWILPGKMLAFASPSNVTTDEDGMKLCTPEEYSVVFKSLGITAVVRLNNKTYEAERFVKNGIKHYDLFFVDGSVPDESIIKEFLAIAENEKALAVHCKAGLGRTGTLIGIYVMKHFNFAACDFIGWIRLCRPGSILGPQQQFLIEIESECKKWASEGPKRPILKIFKKPDKKCEMSPEEHYVSQNGDYGQAERLLSAKKSNQSSPSTPATFTKSPASSTRAFSQTPSSPFKPRPGTTSIFSKNSSRANTPYSTRGMKSRKANINK